MPIRSSRNVIFCTVLFSDRAEVPSPVRIRFSSRGESMARIVRAGRSHRMFQTSPVNAPEPTFNTAITL
jgi:hypothetical protein